MFNLTNTHNVELPLALWLASDEYSYSNNIKDISATSLLRSYRYIIAMKRGMFPEQFSEDLRLSSFQINSLEQDIQDRIPSRMGTAIHSAIDKAIKDKQINAFNKLGIPNKVVDRIIVNPEPREIKEDSICIYTEKRTSREIEGFSISGQFDVVIDGQLHDIKSTSTYVYTSDNNAKKYSLQGSIYRWLNPELITKDTIVINYLFTDWNKNYAFNRDNYPKGRALCKRYPLLSLHDTEMFILNKLAHLKKYWNYPLMDIPCCTDEDKYAGSNPVYKYYKSGFDVGKRSTKNFNSLSEATLYRSKHGGQGEIILDKGKPFKCPFCDMGINNINEPSPIYQPNLEIK